jgi:parvulin-like peptidyl-prolyl isomerase
LKKLSSLLILFALVVGACGAGSGAYAASVDGVDYTVGDVNKLVFDDGQTVSKEQFAQFLGFLIQWDIVTRAADADYGVTFTDEEILASAQKIFEENAAEGTSFEDFLQANAVSEEFLNKVAHLQLVETDIRIALEAELEPPSQEDLDAQRELAYDNLTEVCASHILVATEEEANDVLDRIDSGEAFADLAMELSTDLGSGAEGGDLGCNPPNRFVEEFAAAALEADIDVPFGPVESQFGFHILLVTSRTFPADDELPTDDEITETLKVPAINQALTDWIGGHLAAAQVTVDEKYGTWQTEPAGVVPPA